MDSRNYIIGVLSTTAAVLFVGVVITLTRPAPVYGAGMTVSGGDFILSVGTGTQIDEEYLYVIDLPAQKMLAYRFDGNRGTIDIVQGVDLSTLREPPPARPGGRP